MIKPGDGKMTELMDAATAHLTAREYRECHALCIEAIKLDPHHGEPYFLLAILTADHDNFQKALELSDRAIACDAHNPKYLALRAKFLTTLNRHEEASDDALRAAELSPVDPFTVDTLGVVFSRIGNHQSAVPFFRMASEHDPQNADYQYNLGSSLKFSGDFAEAETAYSRVLELEPDTYKAYFALTSLKKQTPDDNRIVEMTALLEGCNDADGRLHLGHALAKSHEDIGDYAKALEYLKAGKRQKREQLAYGFSSDQEIFDAALGVGGLPIDPDLKGEGGPIFIVGMPRTGTTLVDRILSSHSKICSVGELTHFGLILKQVTQSGSKFVLDKETLEKAADVDLAAVGQDYARATERLRGGFPFAIDKMPLNFFYASLILAAMPNARIICLRRNPMDACLSNYRQLFRTSYSYYNYSYDLEDTGRYYAQFDRLMGHWSETLPASRFTEVKYEQIIADQDGETRRLLDFCGVEFEEACLNFHQNEAPIATASSVQVRQPLYSSSIGRWKKYGDGLQPLMDILASEGIQINE